MKVFRNNHDGAPRWTRLGAALLAAAVFATAAAACAQEAQFPSAVTPQPGTVEPLATDLPSTGTIDGLVLWSGPVPEAKPLEVNADERYCAPGGELASDRADVDPETRGVRNAVVWLERADGEKLPPADAPPGGFGPYRMEIEKCQFQPSPLVVPSGERLWVTSRDQVLHKVTMTPEKGYARSFTLAFNGAFESVRLRTGGVIRLRCGRHPWEWAAAVVAEHRFYTLSDAAGAFSLSDVPPGDYYVNAWHDAMAPGEQTVKAGLVTGYEFGAGTSVRTRVQVPLTPARPVRLTLKDQTGAQ